MRQIRKILRDKRGEGYIDVAVMVLCVMLVIALGVRLFPIFITKMQVDNFADELAREAEISGRVGSETSNRQRVLEERTGIHPTVQCNGYRYHTKGLRVVWKLWFVSDNHPGKSLRKE